MTVISKQKVQEYKQNNEGFLYGIFHSHPIQNADHHLVVTALELKPKDQPKDRAVENKNHSQGRATTNNDSKLLDENEDNIQKTQSKPQVPNTKINEPTVTQKKPKTEKSEFITRKTVISNTPNYSDIAETLKNSDLLDRANVKTQLYLDLDNLSTKEIKTKSLSNGEVGYMPLDHELFHLLSNVVIGKNLNIMMFFRDGSSVKLAPEKWGTDSNLKELLINHDFLFNYYDLNVSNLVNDLKKISYSTLILPEYTQFWIPFLPIIPANQ